MKFFDTHTFTIQKAVVLCFAGTTFFILALFLSGVYSTIQLYRQSLSLIQESVIVNDINSLGDALNREMVAAASLVSARGINAVLYTQSLQDWQRTAQETTKAYQDIQKIIQGENFVVDYTRADLVSFYARIESLRQQLNAGNSIPPEKLQERYEVDDILSALNNIIFQPRSAEEFAFKQFFLVQKYVYELRDSFSEEAIFLNHALVKPAALEGSLFIKLQQIQYAETNARNKIADYVDELKHNTKSDFLPAYQINQIKQAAVHMERSLESYDALRLSLYKALQKKTGLNPDEHAAFLNMLSASIGEVKRFERLIHEVSYTTLERETFRQIISKTAALLLYIAALFCLLSFFSFIKRHILKPVELVTEKMDRLAGGALDVELPMPSRQDEIGKMMKALYIFKQKALADREQQKMVSLGHLAGGISHEINNALMPIIGLSEMLIKKHGDDSALKQSLETMRGSAMHARAIVGDILTFARHDSRKKEMLLVGDAISQAANFAGGFLPAEVHVYKTGLGFDKALPDTTYIMVNKTGLAQVFTNLFINANHAMPKGGNIYVNVRMEMVEAGDKEKAGLAAGQYVMITVRDTGSGMDQDLLKRIFDPFFTTKDVGKGTGLGLSVIYGLIKEWNGEIFAYSEPGLGTTFRIFLPAMLHDTRRVGS